MLSLVKAEFETIKRSAFVFTSSLASASLFIANMYLATLFIPADYGLLKTVLSLLGVFPVLLAFGFQPTLTRYIAREHKHAAPLFQGFLYLRLAAYFFTLLLLLAFQGFFISNFLQGHAELFLPSLALFLLSFFAFFPQVLVGFQRITLFSISNALYYLSSSVFMLLGAVFFGIPGALIGSGFGYLIFALPSLAFCLKRKLFTLKEAFPFREIVLSFSLPMYFLSLPSLLFHLVLPLFSLFFSAERIGYLAFALVFYSGVSLFPSAISITLLPSFSELHKRSGHAQVKAKLKHVLFLYSGVVLLSVPALVLLAQPLISLIAPAYLPATFMFIGLTSLSLLLGYLNFASQYYVALNRLDRVALITLASTLIVFVVSWGLMVWC